MSKFRTAVRIVPMKSIKAIRKQIEIALTALDTIQDLAEIQMEKLDTADAMPSELTQLDHLEGVKDEAEVAQDYVDRLHDCLERVRQVTARRLR